MNKILTKEEYFAWEKEKHDVDLLSKECEGIYMLNAASVRNAVTNILDDSLCSRLQSCETAYSKKLRLGHTKDETALFMSPSELVVKWHTKPYLSVLDKVYRYNVVDNKAWDSDPPGGRVGPENWFVIFNDMVRTRIVCKYIDGPKYLSEELGKLAKKLKLESRSSSRQKDDGYYAYHFYVNIPVEIVIDSDLLKEVMVPVEIQVTTQLQDVLSKITHQFYEKSRIQHGGDPSSWKWEYDDDRFRVAYLSHALHLLEAIIHETQRRRNSHHQGG